MKSNKVILLLIFLIILAFKLKDISYFIYKENIITGYDAYYYARLTDEFSKGLYEKIDKLRDVPDFLLRPDPIPLIVVLGSFFSKIFSEKLVFAYVPTIFSILFIIPLFFWIRRFANIYVFIPSALVGSLNLIYFSRTYIGKYDTDFLILFFVFLIIYLITLSVENIKYVRKSVYFIIFAGISYLFFRWFYYKPVFAYIFLFSLFLGYISFYFKSFKKYLKNFLLVFLTFLIPLLPDLLTGLSNILQKLKAYVLKEDISSFLPTNPEAFVTELQPVNLQQLIEYTVANPVIFILSAIGLLLLFIKKWKYISISIPIFFLGLLSLKAGNRFIIYLAPFIGLGFGYFAYEFFSFIKRYFYKPVYEKIFIALLIFFSIPANTFFIKIKSAVSDEVYKDMLFLKDIVPQNSYLWTWWDYGYILEFLSRRGTYVDNGNKDVIKNYCIARSFITSSEDEAFKLISFITNHKRKEYKDLKFDEFRKKVSSYKRKPKNPVYILIFNKYLFYQYFYMIGMISSGKKEFNLPAFKIFKECKKKGKIYNCGNILEIDGNLKVNMLVKGKNIKKVVAVKDKKRFELENNKGGNLVLEIRIKDSKAYFTLVEKLFYKSIINRMYFLREKFKNFELVYDDFPYMVVYTLK